MAPDQAEQDEMKKINGVIMLIGFVALSPEAFAAIDNAGVMDNVKAEVAAFVEQSSPPTRG